MNKKKTKEVEKETIIEPVVPVADTGSSASEGMTAVPAMPLRINPLVGDLGREDLNLLAQKINEIIEFLNK